MAETVPEITPTEQFLVDLLTNEDAYIDVTRDVTGSFTVLIDGHLTERDPKRADLLHLFLLDLGVKVVDYRADDFGSPEEDA